MMFPHSRVHAFRGIVTGLVVCALTVHLTGCGPFSFVADGGSQDEPTNQDAPTDGDPMQAVPLSVTSIAPQTGSVEGNTLVTITGAGLQQGLIVLFGGNPGEIVLHPNDTSVSVLTPRYAAGAVDVAVLSPTGETVTMPSAFVFDPVAPVDDPEPPALRVVGAVARNNKTVLITFNAETDASANEARNYEITGSDLAFLTVTAANQSLTDKRVVTLNTLSQGADMYTVHVVGVNDINGNPMAASDGLLAFPDGPDPSRARFAGIPPGALIEQIDSDGDGIADWFEMQGWMVTVRFTNGTTSTFHVTSDPFNRDTDGDGFNDATENALSLDPRSNDTDVDLVTDLDEREVWRSDPADQDTDRDGFGDYLEITQFHTSPVLADTDGDQFDDNEEILSRNRNPRLADLPVPQIVVGEMNLAVNETFSYTDERGTEISKGQESSVTMSQGTERRFSTSSTQSMESTDTFSQELEIGYGDGSAAGGWYGRASVGAEQERSRGYSFETSNESAISMQQEFSDSVSESQTFSERREVTRNVESASIEVDVSLINAGNIAFTISNLELSVRIADATRRDVFLPLAALVPASGTNSFNLGPFDSQRGPFIFNNTEIFANRVLDLLRQPRAIVFDVANYDVSDEFGRNFVFSSEEINDRTAGITIDFGSAGNVETYRVATASTFDAQGRSRGITMGEALIDIIGLDYVANDTTVVLPGTDTSAPAIRDSFGTNPISLVDPTQVVTRIRGVQSNLERALDDKRFWVVLSSGGIPPGTNFTDIVLKPRERYLIWYVQDNDDDKLFAREEFMAGSSDNKVDTDGDGIDDHTEVKVGWEVAIPGARYTAFPSPARADTDFDGVDDPTERRLKTDPTLQDTDDDGLSDETELEGFEIVLFDGDLDSANNPVIVVAPYTDAAIIEPRAGGDGLVDTEVDVATSDDVQVIAPGDPALPGDVVVRPGPNGVLETVPAGDEFVSHEGEAIIAMVPGVALTEADPASDDLQIIAVGDAVSPGEIVVRAGNDAVLQTVPVAPEVVRALHTDFFATSPLLRDTDGDSLADGREAFLGSNPNVADAGTVLDSDLDGLTDNEEMVVGWDVAVIDINGSTTITRVFSDPEDPDSDNDGMPDLLEFSLRTNPNQRDTDGDGLGDLFEYDPDDPNDYFDDVRVSVFESRCAAAFNCTFTPAEEPVGSNPLDVDTDNDTRDDGAEVNVPWDVCVSGAGCIEVFSNPLDDDADGDTLGDATEFARGTHPDDPDTDGDGRLDGPEVLAGATHSFGAAVFSNPLVPDRLVSARYVRAEIKTDWDDGDGQNGGEFTWTFRITVNATTRILEQQSSSVGISDDGLPNDFPGFSSSTFAFVVDMATGSFNFNGEIREDDPAPNEDETASFSQAFGPPLNFGVHSPNFEVNGSEGGKAQVYVTYTVHQ